VPDWHAGCTVLRSRADLEDPVNTVTTAPLTPTGAAARVPSGWGDRVRRIALDMRQLGRDHAELAVLEAQRASQTFVRIVVAAVAISVLGATAWLGLVAAIVVWITDAGVSWPVALLIGAVACLAAAGAIAWWIKQHVTELLFSATLRQLRASAGAEGDEGDES
jgi:uncharacterized membrane protein YqjE